MQGELQYFRERMRPVIFCNTVGNGGVIQALLPRTGEVCVSKTGPNAFYETELLTVLKSLKVTYLTIVGAFSHASVLATAIAALDHGFSVVVPETCVCAADTNDHVAALRLINRWLSY